MNPLFIALTFFSGFNAQAAIDRLHFKPVSVTPVVVAIVDTGADIDHQELKKYIWTNPGESGKDSLGQDKENNQIDDDDNGFIDDLHGWNFVDNNNKVDDFHGHGTHIAGIIKNEFLKSRKLEKNKPGLQLMILKYYSATAKNEDNIQYSTQAIRYANKMQARVINYSGGGGQKSADEFLAISQSERQNILFIAAAGNNKSNTDLTKYYPASYQLNNMISVAATNASGDLMSFSNYGRQSIDVAAPGQFIFSTLPKNKFGIMSGTSQATAFVTGFAAFLLAESSQTENSAKAILQQIIARSHFNKSLEGKTKYKMALISP